MYKFFKFKFKFMMGFVAFMVAVAIGIFLLMGSRNSGDTGTTTSVLTGSIHQ